jgi:hypothetical protein
MTKLATAARGRSMTDDEQHDFDAAASEVASLDEQITAAEAAGPGGKEKTVNRAEAAEIVKLCVDGGVPMMASGMLAEGISVEDAKARIASAGKAKEIVALARKKDASIPADLAATMLAEGKTVEEIRTAVFDKLVASEEKTSISSHVPTASGNAGVSASRASMDRVLKRSNPSKEA